MAEGLNETNSLSISNYTSLISVYERAQCIPFTLLEDYNFQSLCVFM